MVVLERWVKWEVSAICMYTQNVYCRLPKHGRTCNIGRPCRELHVVGQSNLVSFLLMEPFTHLSPPCHTTPTYLPYCSTRYTPINPSSCNNLSKLNDLRELCMQVYLHMLKPLSVGASANIFQEIAITLILR